MIQRLEDGLRGRLTLISAPAGFGKTTLVSSWLHSRSRDDYSVAWLSLDERDNDTERFLTYLIEALHLADSSVGATARELLASSVETQPEQIIVQLINDAGFLSCQIVLVLDDYHLIENPEIHEALDFFIDNLPPQLHVVMTSRSDPPLSLSRWRGRREMVEIRTEDLRFTAQEIEDFLEAALGQEVGSEDVEVLEQRTEGWITGLQLAAISLRNRADVHDFIHSFSGQHHHIFDYLVDEVLNRETPETQDFLLQTSLFGQFTADLCDAVTGRSDSQATLEYLERSNLFLISLDSERRWYRYHHLFADLLRRRLRQTKPAHVAELRRRASIWFEERGDPVEAIWQAINGEDWPRLRTLVKDHHPTLFNQGLSKVIIRMFQAVPEEVVQSDPWLLFVRAAALDLNGEIEQCDRDLTVLEDLIIGIDQDPRRVNEYEEDELRQLRASLSRTRAFTAVLDLDFEMMRERADLALRYLPEDLHGVRSLTMGVRAQSFWLVGDLENAAAGLRDAIAVSQRDDGRPARLVGLLGLASVEVEWGRFEDAAARYAEAVEFAQSHDLGTWQYTGRIMSFQSEVPYEWNRLDEALEIALRGREIVGHWASRHAFDVSFLYLARIHYALGDIERARALLRQSPPFTGYGPGFGVATETEAFQALVDLEAGERSQLAAIEADLTTPVSELIDLIWLWTPTIRARARVLNALDRYDDATALLVPLLDICIERGWTRQAIQTGAVLAISHYGQGDAAGAVRVFERTLPQAEAHGFLRSILDAGPIVGNVIEATRARRRQQQGDTAYLDNLLKVAKAEHQGDTGKAPVPDHGLVDPLSEREIEVLQLIAAGHTNAVIADQLYVVVGTVKAHTHNIYSKLGVRNRTQAVNRGRELGLVE